MKPYLYEEHFNNCHVVIAGYDKKRLTVFLRPAIIQTRRKKKKKKPPPALPKIIYQADSIRKYKLKIQLKLFKKGKIFGTYHNLDI